MAGFNLRPLKSFAILATQYIWQKDKVEQLNSVVANEHALMGEKRTEKKTII